MSTERAKDKGIPVTRTCKLWNIHRRRVTRWRSRFKRGLGLENGKPGPRESVHRLLPVEKASVLKMARLEQFADLSHRILAVTAWDEGFFFVSFSSVYRILRSQGLATMRGKHGRHNGRSLPPVRKELTGPNQRWCWDISYLPTHEKGLFLYLYLLLDEYSRKTVHWLVSWYERACEAERLIEGGLLSENILDLSESMRPEIVNDRGCQMKAKTIKKLFEIHQMPQIFARPRTPNYNPFVESAFGTIKQFPLYPGRFLDQLEAIDYFDRFFCWYNTEHYHSGIDYVTPDQCHRGLRDQIVAKRKTSRKNQQNFRKEVNRITSLLKNPSASIYNDPVNLMTCSVIPP